MNDSSIATIGVTDLAKNKELAKLYADNAEAGSENLGGVSPLLKIHTAGKSTTNQLVDGSDPHEGYFFYKPTKEEFKEVLCHILTISKGFRSDGLNGKKEVFNQIMSGVIVNDGQLLPFMMYLTGGKLAPMWDFGKEAKAYTHAKPVGIPMFALKVKLSTSKRIAEYAPGSKTPVHDLKFEIVKNEDGSPELVSDVKLFETLKSHLDMAKQGIDAIIKIKAPEEELDRLMDEVPNEESTPVYSDDDAEMPMTATKKEKLPVSAIPF